MLHRRGLCRTVFVAAVVYAAADVDAPIKSHAARTPKNTPPDFVNEPHETPVVEPGAPTAGKLGGPAARAIHGSFTSVQVNVASGSNILGDAANEPSIAVDPNNPSKIAIAWRQFNTIFNPHREAGRAYSSDGGRTWTFPGVLEPGVFRSDPVLGFDSNGTFYYNSLKVVNNNFTCDVFTSNDGGQTWGTPVFAHGGDKQWMIIDRSGGVGHGNIYASWSTAAACCGNNIFTRSTDGGISYDIPVPIQGSPRWGTGDVGPDGTLYIPGIDAGDPSRFLVARSSNAQNAGQFPVFTTVTMSMGGAVSVGVPNGPNPAGLLGQVWLGVDRSGGPRHGYVYMVCSVNPPGDDPLDVHFSRSTDGGQSWSTPVRINDDVTTNAWQWFGTMSVAPNGRIDIIWNDTRNTGVSNQSELFYAFSVNGGTSWSVNEQLSPSWDSHVGWPQQNKIGDYYHMISDNVGAHLAWSATFNNEQDVYYLRIGDYDCNVNGIGDAIDISSGQSTDLNQNGIPDDCEGITVSDASSLPEPLRLDQNSPNPFNPSTAIRFHSQQDGVPVQLEVFDVAGRHVRWLFSGKAHAGDNVVHWDGRNDEGTLSSAGVYYYRLIGLGEPQVKRMVMLK